MCDMCVDVCECGVCMCVMWCDGCGDMCVCMMCV